MPTSTATAAASICGTTLAASAAVTYPASSFATGSFALPPLGQCSTSITFGSGVAFSNPNVTITTSQVAPAGAPVPLPTPGVGGSITPLLFETLTVNSGTISVTSSQQQTLTVESFPPAGCGGVQQYFAEVGTWFGPNASAGTTATTATFPNALTPGATLTAGNTYYEYFGQDIQKAGC